MKKGQTLHNIKVSTIGFWGVGIGIAENGKKILIKWSVLPHSVIDCIIIKAKRDHILAMPIRVVSIEPERSDADPLCPHYSNPLKQVAEDYVHKNGCGWCKWQLLSYAKQLELKTHLVHDSFRGASYLLEQVPLQDIIPSPITYQYRNKIEFSFWKYITKAKNDRKAQKQRGEEVIETILEVENELATGNNTENKNSDFSHYHERQLGFHKQGFYTHVIDVDQCYLISEKLHTVYNHIKNLCKNSGLPVHDPKTHLWIFRHLVMRQWYNTNQILVNLVVSDEQVNTSELSDLWATFKKELLSDEFLRTECTTFLLTYNNTVSDAVRRQDTDSDVLWGQGHIFEELHFHKRYITTDSDESDIHYTVEDGQIVENTTKSKVKNEAQNTSNTTDIRFRISPFSFFQTNTLGAQELFSKAASFIQLSKNKQTIMDLYCGAGTIGLSLLAQGIGNFVIGIEIVEDAIKDANYNAKINKLDTQSYFAAGKTEVLLKNDAHISAKLDDVGLVIVDPPREWLHKDVCEFLINLKKDHKFQLIYISCNPVTLARDLDLLVQGWWNLQTLQPVDMFPHTHHVEMISVLS